MKKFLIYVTELVVIAASLLLTHWIIVNNMTTIIGKYYMYGYFKVAEIFEISLYDIRMYTRLYHMLVVGLVGLTFSGIINAVIDYVAE